MYWINSTNHTIISWNTWHHQQCFRVCVLRSPHHLKLFVCFLCKLNTPTKCEFWLRDSHFTFYFVYQNLFRKIIINFVSIKTLTVRSKCLLIFFVSYYSHHKVLGHNADENCELACHFFISTITLAGSHDININTSFMTWCVLYYYYYLYVCLAVRFE